MRKPKSGEGNDLPKLLINVSISGLPGFSKIYKAFLTYSSIFPSNQGTLNAEKIIL